jgi:hypothetical protein
VQERNGTKEYTLGDVRACHHSGRTARWSSDILTPLETKRRRPAPAWDKSRHENVGCRHEGVQIWFR